MAPHHAHSARRTPPVRLALAALATAAALLAEGCAQSPSSSDSASPSQGSGNAHSSPSSPGSTGARGAAGDEASHSATPTAQSPAPGARHPEGKGTPSPSRHAGGFPRCSPGMLSAALRGLESAAGNRYAALVFINTANKPCRTRGWPGLQLVSDSGAALPTDTARDRSVRSQPLTLKPDDRAWSRLHWTVVPGTGDPADGSCPEPVALRAIPPDERGQLRAEWRLGTVCGAGEIEATALRTGEGPPH